MLNREGIKSLSILLCLKKIDQLYEDLESCCIGFSFVEDSHQLVNSYRSYFLNEKELITYNNLYFPQRRQSYLLGRYAAKLSIHAYTKEKDIKNFCILNGVFNQPFIEDVSLEISISHSEQFAVATTSPQSFLLAIDIEKNEDVKLPVFFSKEENELLNKLDLREQESFRVFWSAKEALGKILRIGLTANWQAYEISKVTQIKKGVFIIQFSFMLPFQVLSFVLNRAIISFALPQNFYLESPDIYDLLIPELG